MKFKQKFGNCDARRTKSDEYQSLGQWRSHMRISYKKIRNRETPTRKITEDHIPRQLEAAGFKWTMSTSRTFDMRYAELMRYKEKCGQIAASKMITVSVSSTYEYAAIGKNQSAISGMFNEDLAAIEDN